MRRKLFRNVLSESEVKRIIAYTRTMNLSSNKRAGIGRCIDRLHTVRDCCVRHVKPMAWLQCKLRTLVDGDDSLLFDHMQLTVYAPGNHYNTWHTDADLDGTDPEDARVHTFIVMLKPCDAGGALEFRDEDDEIHSDKLYAGDVVCFDAKRDRHRVTPVEDGLRITAVIWMVDDTIDE